MSIESLSLSLFVIVIVVRQRSLRTAESRCEWFHLLFDRRRCLYYQDCLEKRSSLPSESTTRLLSESDTKPFHIAPEVLRSLLLSKCEQEYSFRDYEQFDSNPRQIAWEIRFEGIDLQTKGFGRRAETWTPHLERQWFQDTASPRSDSRAVLLRSTDADHRRRCSSKCLLICHTIITTRMFRSFAALTSWIILYFSLCTI